MEIRLTEELVSIRDGKHNDLADQPIITVGLDRWVDYVDHLCGLGPEAPLELYHDVDRDGTVAVRSTASDVVLRYTAEEWTAFIAGVRAGQFRPVHASV